MLMLTQEITMIFKLIISTLLVSVLGLERKLSRKPGGIRTIALVGCATTLFTVLALQVNETKILAGIITGIGFLGGGVIIKEKRRVMGLTTAAMVWMVAAIGISVGLGFYLAAISTTILSFLILRSKTKRK